jgi:hypothetical protein
MNKQNLGLKQSLTQLNAVLPKLRRYSFLGFLVFVLATYGFVVLRIQSLSSTPPSNDAIINQAQSAGVPRIDPTVLRQLQSLHDNSVSVQTLFEEARNNPFQE